MVYLPILETINSSLNLAQVHCRCAPVYSSVNVLYEYQEYLTDAVLRKFIMNKLGDDPRFFSNFQAHKCI